MLAQLRHIQKGILIAVTAVVVVSFAFLYSDYDFVAGAMGGGNCVVKVYDRCYRNKEAQKLASNFEVAYQMGMYDFAMVLFGENRMDRDMTEFVISLVVLRHEAQKLGIEPSPEEIKAAIPQLPIFQQPWVNAAYVDNNVLGPNGFTQSDLAQLVKDYLSYQKLRDLIGAGVEALPSEAARRYIQNNQRYNTTLVRFDRADHLKDVKVSDEDVKKYYEENKESLLSEPKRVFDFVKFTAKPVAADATNEAKAKAKLNFANATNYAYADLAEDGVNFSEVAKKLAGTQAEFTAEVGSLPAFARKEPAKILEGRDEALNALFSEAMQVGGVSVPVEAQEGVFLVFHLASVVAPAPLTLEQATPAIREVLLTRRSNEAVNAAASDSLAKLNEAEKAGKSFAETAKALGLKQETLSGFSITEPPANVADADLIVRTVEGLSEKGTSGVVERPAGAGYMIAHVNSIEIYKDDQADAKKKALAASIKVQTDHSLFRAWFNQKRKESSPSRSANGGPLEI